MSDHKGAYPLVTYHHMYPYTTYQCKQMNKYILVYRTFARKMTKQLNNNSRMHMNIELKYQDESSQFENSFTEFY